MSGLNTLARQMLVGEWRAHPVRTLLAVAAIAVGVALGFAIDRINATAIDEFNKAVTSLAGQADVQVSGREPLFDETIFPQLAAEPDVAIASPVLELTASVPGSDAPIRVIGLDPLRAAALSPDLLGTGAGPTEMLADDAIFLSNAAQQAFKRQPGATLTVRAGAGTILLRVAGGVLRAPQGRKLGVMDIGAAQWRFGLTGRLSRIDLKLREGVNRDAFVRRLSARLEASYPGRFHVAQPNDPDQASRNSSASRAYRVNLTVLALVALFTGAFLVFSTQALSVIRRRSQFALLRVLGLERRQLLRQVLVEGAALGVTGSLLGLAAGYGLAVLVLQVMGGADLGAGFFSGGRPQVSFAPLPALGFFVIGVGAALAGCLGPALEAARAAPAIAIKSGTDEAALAPLARLWPPLACIALAAVLARLPAVNELPLFGYASIGLLLVGAIGLMPRLAASAFGLINRIAMRRPRHPVLALTLARLANASGQASIALGGVLSSFSLMVAMAIMVASFRVSLTDWLEQILPADVYLRVAAGAASGSLGPAEQAALSAVPGVARAQFQQVRRVLLAPERPAVAIIARQIDPLAPERGMMLTGESRAAPPGAMPAWVSEAMLDLYQIQVGQTIRVPLGGAMRPLFVAGAWRDYAAQNGAIQLRLEDYRRLTGDVTVSDGALWLAGGAHASEVIARIRKLPLGSALDVIEPGEIRAMSLTIFDRSFAVTYVLEAIAIAIGLTGVAATFSAQTLARAKEFGMLRHVGVTRGQILRILALEGGALTALGVAIGFVLGWLISLVLVFVVNPQSFHWTMQLHLPWRLLAAVASLLLGASMITALLSGRHALSAGPIRAVRQDW